jgi:predicted RNA binding protein YcfA (HicA-like mRNA interferase family)
LKEISEVKYSEVERMARRHGCTQIGEMGGHPLWYSPITGKVFRLSHHGSQEVKKGTLNDIIKRSGLPIK